MKFLLLTAASSFFTPWTGYVNQLFNADLSARHDSSTFVADFSLRLSNSPSYPVLGNVRELLLRGHLEQMSWRAGIDAPSPTFFHAHAGVHESLNRSICSSLFDCTLGGPVGAGIGFGRVSLFATALTIPNIGPGPNINAQGVLESRDRWAETPIENVDLGDVQLPLYNSVHVVGGLGSLTRPGLRLSARPVESRAHRVEIITSFAVAESALQARDAKLAFSPINGTPSAVVHNNIEAEFLYEGIASLQTTHDFGGWAARSEATWAQKTRGGGRASGLVESQATNWLFKPAVGVGILHDPDSALWLQGSLEDSFGRWLPRVSADVVSSNKAHAWHVAPQLGFRLVRNSNVRIEAHLIAGDAEAPIFGPFRGNDSMAIGWTYEI